jgi:hypothetical protein
MVKETHVFLEARRIRDVTRPAGGTPVTLLSQGWGTLVTLWPSWDPEPTTVPRSPCPSPQVLRFKILFGVLQVCQFFNFLILVLAHSRMRFTN